MCSIFVNVSCGKVNGIHNLEQTRKSLVELAFASAATCTLRVKRHCRCIRIEAQTSATTIQTPRHPKTPNPATLNPINRAPSLNPGAAEVSEAEHGERADDEQGGALLQKYSRGFVFLSYPLL